MSGGFVELTRRWEN